MVPTSVFQVLYQGDGETTAFPFTWPYYDADNIRVAITDSDGNVTVLTSDYYVNKVNNTVYYPGYAPGSEPPLADQPPVLAIGETISIYRDTPITQTADLGDKWPYATIEKGLDKLTMILQESSFDVGHSLHISSSAMLEDFDTEVPISAGKSIRVNDDGTGFVTAANPDVALSKAIDAETAAQTATNTAQSAVNTAQTAMSTAQAALNTIEDAVDNTYKKKIVAELPLKFAGYSDALSAVGGSPSYIYPQGWSFDKAGNVYIKYSGNTSGTYSAIVKYDNEFNYVGWLLIDFGGESIVVLDSGTKKYLYSKHNSALYRYDITSATFTGETKSGTSVLSNVALDYSYNNGRWLVGSSVIEYGNEESRTHFRVYDDSFTQTGQVFVSRLLTGWQLTSDSNYQYVPKMQGVSLCGDKVYISHGGSYIPAVDGATSNPVADIGCSEISMDGSLLRYGVVKADAFISKLNALGYTYVLRTEAEGTSVDPDGNVCSLYVVLRPGSASVTTKGLLIVKEFAPDGEDFSDIASDFTPFNLQRIVNGTFPRNASNNLINPLTYAGISTLTDLLDLMVDMQIPKTMFYSSTVTITNNISGVTITSPSLVEIINANNITVVIRVNLLNENAGGSTTYYVNNSGGTWTAYATAMGHARYYMPANSSYSGSGGVLRRVSTGVCLAAEAYNDDGGAFLELHGRSTSSNPGRFDLCALTGSGEKHLYGTAAGSLTWDGQPVQTSSDKRLKTEFGKVPAKVLKSWGKVKWQQFKYVEDVERKGTDSCRYHTGLVAQDVKDACGDDVLNYGILCHDEERDLWTVRYEEALCMEAEYQRRKVSALEKRIKALENKLKKLEENE